MEAKTVTSATGSASRKGYTLVELLVVLAILVGLAAAFPLALERLSPARQVQVYAERLISDLRLLRAQAMKQGVTMALVIDDATNSYRMKPDGSSHALPTGITIQIDASSPHTLSNAQQIRFYSDGSSDGGAIRLVRENREARLTVSALTARAVLE